MDKLKVLPHVNQCVLAHSWGGITARCDRFAYLDAGSVAFMGGYLAE
jgi:hypothetical protein